MSTVDTIEIVLNTNLLMKDMIVIPSRGATEDEIRNEQLLLGRVICPDHGAILRRWNGIVLDVIRLFGCGDDTGEVRRLSAMQLNGEFDAGKGLVVGSDAAGFVYFQRENCEVFSLDTDGGSFKKIADNLDELFEYFVFGPGAASFAGEEWLSELREFGIVNS